MYFCVQYKYFTFQLLSLHKRLSLTDTENLGKNLHHQTYQNLMTRWFLAACLKVEWPSITEVRGHLLGDCVGVQIHTADVSWGHVKVKVSGVHTDDERARSAEHIGQCQRAQRDVGARPVEGEDHLKRWRQYDWYINCRDDLNRELVSNLSYFLLFFENFI